MSTAGSDLSKALESQRRFLFGLCYRMTGSAADAEDLVQETFLRAIDRPPRDATRPWRPWLVRVAMNLARDQLRRRRRQAYVGPWLPEPLETEALGEPSFEPRDTVGRYELLESVSYAFLLALEALTPAQRAVLLLRDVFEYTAAEAAAALGMSEGNVRVTQHRARLRMRRYEARRCVPNQVLVAETRDLLQRFVLHMAHGDVSGMQALLADEVVSLNDSNGAYSAARVPVVGAAKVARFHKRILRALPARAEVRLLNGLPALVGEFDHDPAHAHLPPRFVLLPIPAFGRLVGLHSLVAPAKLAKVKRPSAPVVPV